MKRLFATIGIAGFVFGCTLVSGVPQELQIEELTPIHTATSTDLPLSPLPSLTPSEELRPPPTFEPPTRTPAPSDTPTVTPTITVDTSFSLEGLRGAETPTPTSTPGCEVREDWTLTYEVQFDDALARVAEQFGTTADAIARGNCLDDPDLIRIGQRLRVPGDNLPPASPFDCERTWELLTPLENTLALGWDGELTFNWRGPRAPINLIRIYQPDGSVFERIIERRQNEIISLEEIPQGGNYTWQVFPLNANYSQPASCSESPRWRFTKQQRPPNTPTPTTPAPFAGAADG